MSMAIFHSKLLVITRGFGDDTIPSTFIGDVFLIVFNYPLTIVGLSTISTSYIQYISSYIHCQRSSGPHPPGTSQVSREGAAPA